MRARTARRVAGCAAAGPVTLIGAGLALACVGRHLVSPSLAGWMFSNVSGQVVNAAVPVVGFVLASRRPANRIGWLFLVAGLALGLSGFSDRTLAYAIVTGLLVGVYGGLVLLATQVLSLSSPVAVAASTLVAAALFSPLRRRVQRVVDRRFNRARYDADQTVAAFAARLKDAMDLDAVRDDLAGVVHRALQPAHVSLWVTQRGPHLHDHRR